MFIRHARHIISPHKYRKSNNTEDGPMAYGTRRHKHEHMQQEKQVYTKKLPVIIPVILPILPLRRRRRTSLSSF